MSSYNALPCLMQLQMVRNANDITVDSKDVRHALRKLSLQLPGYCKLKQCSRKQRKRCLGQFFFI